MSRHIDADALYQKLYPLDLADKRKYTINAKAVADAIASTPTADVVEVVRCKDCIHYEIDEEGFGHCGNSNGYDAKDYTDYCNYGERRAEE